MKKILCLLALAFMMCESATAQICFEKTVINDTVSPLKGTYEFKFPFSVGKDGVIIDDVCPTCVCIKLDEPRKGQYKAKENGVIKGYVDLSGKSGELYQAIMVDTMLGGEYGFTKLKINLKIVEIVKISQTLLFWPINGEQKTENIFFDIDPKYVDCVESISCKDESFVVKYNKSKDRQNRYEVSVYPKSTKTTKHEILQFKVKTKKGSVDSFFAHLLIK